jgi:hypothetical protein
MAYVERDLRLFWLDRFKIEENCCRAFVFRIQLVGRIFVPHSNHGYCYGNRERRDDETDQVEVRVMFSLHDSFTLILQASQ